MKQKTIGSFSIRTAIMLFTLLTSMTAWADTGNPSDGVDYVDADGVLKNTATDGIDENDSPTVITVGGVNTAENLNHKPGWYVVMGSNVEFKGSFLCSGDMHLILADGAKITINSTNGGSHGIDIRNGGLTIYGQSVGTGELSVTSSSRNGIYVYGGDLVINGGKVSATATYGYCGICNYENDIIINDGTVTAVGPQYGIYGPNAVTINGGKVNATYTNGSSSGYGIYTDRNKTITLGFRHEDDQIYVDKYRSNNVVVKVKDGQKLRDNDNNRYTGTISDVSTINGKTLIPVRMVAYIDGDGATQQVEDFTILTGSSANTFLPAGWYVVSGSDVNYSGFLKCESGDIHLILADGAKLTIGDGLIGDDNLTIYGQSGGTGQLVVTSVDKQPIQTLGGLTINGGNINVSTTNNNRNAIKAGANGVTINGGTISATIPNSYSNFYGILTEGAITLGWRSTSDRITVTNYYAMGGVKVKAGQAFMNNDAAPAYLSGTISDMTLIDGKTLRAINPADFELTATNEYTIKSAAGWDVFCDLLADYDNGIFSGKTVKLEKNIEVSRMAGSDKHDFSGNFDGAGHKMTVNISGTSNHIAPFFYLKPQGDNASVTIQNLKVEGTVNAGAKYAGGIVGGCEGTVNIINCVSDVTINSSISGDGTHGGLVGRTTGSGTLNIEGCAFTGKLLTSNGTIKCGGLLGWKSGTGSLNISNSLYAPAEIENGETEVSAEESATFARNGGSFSNSYYTRTLGTEQGAHAYSTATLPLNIGAEVKDYGFVKAYANGVKFNDLYYMVPEAVSLANAEENDVEGKDGYFANVTLTGRTLTKDNAWNTLCLPFSLSAEQIEVSPLAGAVIREMDSSTNLSSNGLLTLNFKDAKSIEAGKAYIVKWTTPGESITEPVFNAVSIENADLTGTESTDGNVKFVGQYSPFTIDESNINSILFIGSSNKIGYSKNPRQLKSCRAHFWVRPNGDTAAARSISVDFGDGVTTSINLVEADNANTANTADGIYTIDGRRVKGEMMQKGVYVVKGKKVVK